MDLDETKAMSILLQGGLAAVGAYLVWWLTQRMPVILDRVFERVNALQVPVLAGLAEVAREVRQLRESMIRHGLNGGDPPAGGQP
jgi:hypothetical protein